MSRGFSKHFRNLAKLPAIVLSVEAPPPVRFHTRYHHYDINYISCLVCEHEKKNSPEARYDRAMTVVE